MVERFYPSAYVRSTYRIDWKAYYDRGYRGLIFDIDNTLVPHDAPADRRARALLRRTRRIGFQAMIVSNNHEPRVKSFADAVGCGYIYEADKPSKKGYLEAARRMGLPKDRVLVIGDQLFTDIWGANRSGMHSVLVGKVYWREKPHIYLKRLLERPILAAYFQKRRRERA